MSSVPLFEGIAAEHKPVNSAVADRQWPGPLTLAEAAALPSEVDLIVVGSGVAGWTAARRATEIGASVAVLDKAHGGPGGGNSLLSGGVFHAAYMDPGSDPEDLREAVLAKVDGAARADVVEAWARNVGRARDYLAAHGASFYRPFPGELFWNVLEPFRLFAEPVAEDPLLINRTWRGMGPHVLLSNLHDEVTAAGGHFWGGTRVRRIEADENGVRGVEAELDSGDRASLSAPAVVLCDGGFAANAELVRKHITGAYRLRGAETNTGDALLMGLELGAKTANMGAFYGHVLHRDSLHNDRLWPDPSPEPLVDQAIVVDGGGHRLVDEWRGGGTETAFADKLGGPVARSATPGDCWLIFDQRLWDTVGKQGVGARLNPTLVEEGARLARADSLEQLADDIGLPAAEFRASVEGFNRYCTEGVAPEPPRSGEPEPLRAPFMAIPLVVGITFTMGGLLVDGGARVLDEDERPIPGLYAAGGTMAGLQGGPRNGYAGGWSEAATFGLLAGESAVADSHRRGD